MPDASKEPDCLPCEEKAQAINDLRPIDMSATNSWTFHGPKKAVGFNPLYFVHQTIPLDNLQRVYPKPIFHPDGSIEYPKPIAAAGEPDEINGYTRDESNPWRFIPDWPECAKRFHGAKYKSNGSLDIRMICKHPDAEYHDKLVTVAICEACPVRELMQRQ